MKKADKILHQPGEMPRVRWHNNQPFFQQPETSCGSTFRSWQNVVQHDQTVIQPSGRAIRLNKRIWQRKNHVGLHTIAH
ncbi:hypothetical protein BG55_22495 [Erwinia mallotivora]|uniref:Uncharacterized protein n=1 Tax=Erwinia mallotivora TaxID=69222 RepID=A0A014M6H7_9GAMM|nr:hypothetical protein BG55_22495 [Erwinia mallotivora]